MARFGVADDYEYNATHRRERLQIWSGPFYSVWEAEGISLPRGDGYMLTTYNGDKVRVQCSTPRGDDNYQEVDRAINDALSAHFASIGTIQLQEED